MSITRYHAVVTKETNGNVLLYCEMHFDAQFKVMPTQLTQSIVILSLRKCEVH